MTQKKEYEYNKMLANIALDIGAVSLHPNKPVRWASGYYMPIYNDNRRLLCKKEYRQLVGNGFKSLIESIGIIESMKAGTETGFEFDILAATPTAGIWPAASAGIAMNKLVCLEYKGEMYLFDEEVIQNLFDYTTLVKIQKNEFIPLEASIIATTSPIAIIPGVWLADKADMPMVYVRQGKKDHGLENQIEGCVLKNKKENKKAVLIDIYIGDQYDSYYCEAESALIEKGIDIARAYSGERSITLVPQSISGKRVVQIEDLISTGGSSLKQALKLRERGAIVEHCIAIYSHELREAEDLFASKGISLHALFTYSDVITAAKKRSYFTKKQLEALCEWKQDPFGWGEKRGFPRINK